MEKPLPKIGGITIERRSKTGAPLNSPGSQPPSGTSAQANKSAGSDDLDEEQVEDDYPDDEYNEYEGDEWPEDESHRAMDEDGAAADEDEEMGLGVSEADSMQKYRSSSETTVKKPSGPTLPPGVTFERKTPSQPVTAAIKPNIKLPPGIIFSKPSSSTITPPVPNLKTSPMRPSQQPVFPRPNIAMSRPAAPVRAVRPRARLAQPRMMINDFLEQGMHIGNNLIAPLGRGRPRAPRPRAPKAQIPLESLFPGFIPRGKLAPRSSNQQRFSSPRKPMPIENFLDLAGQSSEEDVPLRTPQSITGIKLPPGINVERKTSSPVKPQSAKSDRIKLPLTADFSSAQTFKQSLPTNLQLPAGISLERKKSTPVPVPHNASVEDDYVEDDEVGDEVEEGFDEEFPEEAEDVIEESVLPPAKASRPQNIQLPPGVSLQKRSSNSNESSGSCNNVTPTALSSLPSNQKVADDSYEEDEIDPEPEDGVYGEGEELDAEEAETADGEDDDNPENNDEWNDTHENEGEGYEEGSADNDGEGEGEDVERGEEFAPEKPFQDGSGFHDHHEDQEKMAEENDDEEAASELIEGHNLEDEAGEENDPTEDAPMDEEPSDVANEFDPGAEIDFEALIDAPMIPTISSITSGAADMKSDIDEKADLENLMEMMSKGEIEGEIEEDEEDKKGGKRKADEGEIEGESDNKKVKEDDDVEGEGEDEEEGKDVDKSKVGSTHLRKNIREVMDETKLDETTLAAQRQEAERLKRLSDQQRILREVKRQIEISKAADKAQNQSNVLNLLRGNSDLTLKKSGSASSSGASTSSARSQDSVLLKMSNGQQARLNDRMRELLKIPGKSSDQPPRSLLNKAMFSSSVTIAPIKKEQGDEKSKSKDVVELSSDSDDCVVLSEEEPESEPDDDPTNSGMHTSDKYNIRDAQGRVLVNVGHPPTEPDVFLAPQIASIIKPHQIGGVRFLYDNIIESAERYESSAGFGCILAHSMGLGKTLQIVSFSDIFLRHTSAKKILCVMPINTIQNWQAEFNMWLPKENLTGGEIRCREFDVYVVNESSKNIHARGKVILDWHKNGGVLLMGYELFRLLSLRKPIKSKRKIPNDAEEKKNRDLVDDVYAALVKPGPDLVICDEGHRIKNSHATTSQALKQIRTKRRVVLTGYPLQNNLLEYWCMVDFVRPNYLGSKTEFSNMFERPIQNGQCIDSTPQDKRLMRFRAHVLHSQLEGFVQRRSHTVLQQVLPHKQEYVFMLKFTDFQKKLYKTFMNEVVRAVAVPNILKAFAICCKFWNHPDVLYNCLKKNGEARDLDLEETLAPPLIQPPFAGDMLTAPAPVLFPNPTWPKRGPGSRGGKVRQRKGRGSPHNTMAQKEPSEALPSMNQFQMPSTARGSRTETSFTSSTSYAQDSSFNQPLPPFSQTQQSDMKYQGFGSSNQTDAHGNFSDFDESKQTYGGNYSQDPFYQNQFSQCSGNSANGQDQYYQQGNQGYEYNQNAGPTGDFNHMNFSDSGFGASSSSFASGEFPQQNAWGSNWTPSSQGGYSSSSDEFMSPPKFFEEKKEMPDFMAGFSASTADSIGSSRTGSIDEKKSLVAANQLKTENDEKKEERDVKKVELPFEWAVGLFKNYVTGLVENSSKMEVFLVIVEQSVGRGDRMLVFSQSLLTLDLIEEYLQKRRVPGREEHWAKNRNYFRLDGSTPAMEREKLINEFNSNDKVQMFLVSTRAGSLGINLVGANRVVVFDASWNPCHDTQAVCRVYRYGQQKPCYVYRLVMDSCLEKKIYDRQVNKQGMADRIVDELNPDAHLALKDVTNLCWDDDEEPPVCDFSSQIDKYHDDIVKLLLEKNSTCFSRAPFQHESLLVDRKEKKLSKAEKKLAKRSYELEKQAANNPRGIHHLLSNSGARGFSKPIASVKPMQSGVYGGYGGMPPRSKWIPVEVWQKQGMSAQEMTLPLDVVIPTNSPDKTSIILKAGQRVMVLKSPKGIYMQLDTGKIIAIRTSFKDGRPIANSSSSSTSGKPDDKKPDTLAAALKSNPNLTITKNSSGQRNSKQLQQQQQLPAFLKPSSLDKQAAAVNMAATKGRVFQNKSRPAVPPKKPSTPIKKPAGNVETPDVASPLSQDASDSQGSEKAQSTVPGQTQSETTQPTIQMQNEPATEPSPTPDWGGASMSSGNQELSNNPTDQPKEVVTPAHTQLDPSHQAAFGESTESKDVKKEADPANPWGKPGYPMDPYGNYYPGYPGYYGPMPGYDPYMAYPPMPPMKPEPSSDGTPPPSVPQQMPASRPPMYPPYHAPYPYHHYNYPPYPPQGQPGASMPPAVVPPYNPQGQPGASVSPAVAPYGPQGTPGVAVPATTVQPVKIEGGEANTSGFVSHPYGPRPPPPYPQPSSAPPPGFYPNYPPYPPRPFHDPNYPYPNYNPYMPGYGYPMPNSAQINKPPADGNAPEAETTSH